ncbi:hypothetical protein MA16_Dca025666 [Dendrobium catenatum]|uniref:Protein FAR1-RELATED SEQUENCE n=1 Tax=Dendrobium catenatum TaxID=906689 RepID=A0A2I0X7B6_9ASPA|nr:hypothetical protein MA16_Dca025666 [Dendrobium catenatum]
MTSLLCFYCLRVIRKFDIINIPLKYLLMRWSARARKDIYFGQTMTCMGNKVTPSHGLEGKIFRNYFSRFTYQISTRGQENEKAEQYMLTAMTDMAENVDLILDGKKNHKFIANSSMTKKLKDQLKCRPKGISNVRLKVIERRKNLRKKKLRNNLLHQLNNVHQWNQLVKLSFQTYQNASQTSSSFVDQPAS